MSCTLSCAAGLVEGTVGCSSSGCPGPALDSGTPPELKPLLLYVSGAAPAGLELLHSSVVALAGGGSGYSAQYRPVQYRPVQYRPVQYRPVLLSRSVTWSPGDTVVLPGVTGVMMNEAGGLPGGRLTAVPGGRPALALPDSSESSEVVALAPPG